MSAAIAKIGLPIKECTIAGKKIYIWGSIDTPTKLRKKKKCQIRAIMNGEIIETFDYQGDESLCQRYAERLRDLKVVLSAAGECHHIFLTTRRSRQAYRRASALALSKIESHSASRSLMRRTADFPPRESLPLELPYIGKAARSRDAGEGADLTPPLGMATSLYTTVTSAV